jgi:hypothetical protein
MGNRLRKVWGRLWEIKIEQNPRTGELLSCDVPVLRRVLDLWPSALKRHWLAHWKFYIGVAAAWLTAMVAFLQWLNCQP